MHQHVAEQRERLVAADAVGRDRAVERGGLAFHPGKLLLGAVHLAAQSLLFEAKRLGLNSQFLDLAFQTQERSTALAGLCAGDDQAPVDDHFAVGRNVNSRLVLD